MLARIGLRRLLRAAVLLWPGLAAAAPQAPWSEADFLLSDAMQPPAAEAAWGVQKLPDEWQHTRPQTSGAAWYRFRAELTAVPAEVQALYVPRANDRLTVFVNGRLVGDTAAPGGTPSVTWKRPQLFAVPPAMLVVGENLIHLRLEGRAGHYTGLSPVVFGPQAALREAYWKRMALQTFGPTGLAAALGLLGIFFLILWWRHRDDVTYVLFGAASIIWALRNILDVQFHLALPQPHWEILMTTLYFAFVGLLCLFCLRFVAAALPRYERLLRGAMLAVPLLLYAALPWMPVLDAARIALLCMLGFVAPPLAVVAHKAWCERSLGAILIALAGGVAFAFGAYDWIAVGRPGMFDSVRLVPYAALFFTTAVGWMLAHRFLQAYAGLERLNAELDRRVALKSAELLGNLEKLAQAKAEAEAANAAKSRFLAAASHDLRQPLQALGLFAAALAGQTDPQHIRRLAGRIGESVEVLEKLFSGVLDVSRLDAGVLAVERRPFAVQEVFARIAADFLPFAQERGLRLRVRPSAEWTEGDPLAFERILRNLVSNAIRYTRRGGVLVGCRRRGRRLSIEVWDSGIGIDAADRERIFEEFYQVGNAGRDRNQGLGLGLAIVRRLVDLLGDELTLRSVPGRGSVFALRCSRAAPPTAAAAPPLPSPATALHGAGERPLVVLLEDDALVRQALEGLLVQRGLALAGGASFDEACKAARAAGRAPELIVADCRLRDGESGVAAARQLRQVFGAAIPVLLLTGEAGHGGLEEAQASGFPLLRKPVTGARLLAELDALLGGKGVRGEADDTAAVTTAS